MEMFVTIMSWVSSIYAAFTGPLSIGLGIFGDGNYIAGNNFALGQAVADFFTWLLDWGTRLFGFFG